MKNNYYQLTIQLLKLLEEEYSENKYIYKNSSTKNFLKDVISKTHEIRIKIEKENSKRGSDVKF